MIDARDFSIDPPVSRLILGRNGNFSIDTQHFSIDYPHFLINSRDFSIDSPNFRVIPSPDPVKLVTATI
ncbi:hypothetical protein [Salibacterium qingdaonense]|uniref:hypothetical protein n=1 Tax=Salibacterium qingdaonense TaxID=266892 RepID=UPI001160217A|nr:hypothetical protein [Salibacterium qingdaonense]